jgi:cell wall-associated protease
MRFLIFLVLSSMMANAATIAVIDSGVDVEHRDFLDKIWINPSEIADNNRDEDANGYQDDVYGWNFAENNNLVIDRKYLGTFSQDPYKFFEIQGKMFMNTATQEEIDWVNSKRQDPDFLKEMGKFGNFVHGTHVAGITQENNLDAKILSVKLIPTEVGIGKDRNLQVDPSMMFAQDGVRMKLLKRALGALASQQMTMLEEIAHYVGEHKADVANGSFGTGYRQAKMITDNLFKVFFFRAPKPEESDLVAKFFLNTLIEEGKKMAAAAPNTLFVFAAGNDGSNNDVYPTSPTNIQADNVISVAATYERDFIAPFSNYGTKMVDVAAPGMLIYSQIPGDEYLKVSGTSQAAPFVANIAAQLKDINPNLSPLEMKKIIMGTVDKKDYLKEKVKTQGIVNTQRATTAAKLSLTNDLDTAINMSMNTVQDVPSTKNMGMVNKNAIIPMALPSMFK